MKKILIAILLLSLFIIFKFDLQHYLSFSYIQGNLQDLIIYHQQHFSGSLLAFALLYIVVAALSIPGATVLTLAAGAIFGLQVGLILVSFASTIGATLAFLMARFLFRDWVQKRFAEKFNLINQGVKKEGAYYLFTLRLVPLFPFFLVNILIGLTSINTLTYFVVSQLGMLPGTIVYINAGLQLSKLESVSGIMSPTILFSFAILGLFPLLTKKILSTLKTKKIYLAWQRPKQYDFNLIAIGGGSAGLVTAYIGAAIKAKVALVEKHKMGGDCLNTGCVPSKALIKSATVAKLAREGEKYGLKPTQVEVDFPKVMARVSEVIKKIAPHDSIQRYSQLGVTCLQGEAKIISPWEVEVAGKVYRTRSITIATGAGPFVPPIPGLTQIPFLTSDNLWQLKELPKQLAILGGGPIGLELAQAFARLGSQVTVVEMLPRVLIKEDPEVAGLITGHLQNEGVTILTGHKAIEIRGNSLVCESHGNKVSIAFSHLLVAVGRRPHTSGLGLEKLGITIRPNGTIETDEYMRTNYPNIYACGDVTGPYQLTHMASHQAWYCAVNSLFGSWKKFRVDYSVVPWCTYTDPEVATVGLTEEAAKQKQIAYELTSYHLDDLDRAIADSADYGLVRVLTVPGKDKILGATIVGQHASDMLLEFTAAMKNNFGLNKILGTIHSYPSMGEANKYLAGNWRKARQPERLLRWVEKYHISRL